ncbi:hypothetical protein QUF74_05490 [Candidatus Halobeggiatoa sp. HSG11]|nr:hypothetical protein [Candidatus Halobeggiatoa sp. HSG11]
MNLVETVGIQGRDKELLDLHGSLTKGANILLLAPLGYGKTELYEYVKELCIDYDWFYLELSDTAFVSGMKSLIKNYHADYYKQFYLSQSTLNQLSDKAKDRIKRAGKITWSDLSHHVGRTDLESITKILFYSLHWMNKNQEQGHKPILFVKNLKRITDGYMSAFSVLFQQFQVIAILDSRHAHLNHLSILAGNFQNTYELKSLPFDACKAIVIDWLKYNPIEFSNNNVREAFVKHIARDCGGNAGAIAKLLEESLLSDDEVTKQSVQRLEWDGTKYMSLYPLLMVGFIILGAGRALGTTFENPVMRIIGIISMVAAAILYLIRGTLDKVPKG